MTPRKIPEYQHCVECGKDLPEIRQSRQMYCSNPCARTYRKKHIERYASESSYVSMAKENYLRRLRNKNRGNRRELSVEFLVKLWEDQKGLCAISGIPLTHRGGEGRVGTNASIDQIIPSGGYSEGNIQLTTCDVNRMKGTLTMDELYDLCRTILKRNGKDD